MKRLLLYLLTPLHVLSSITAVRVLHPDSEVSVTIIFHAPYLSDQLNAQLSSIVAEMLNGFDYKKKIINISPQDKMRIASAQNIDELRKSTIEFTGADAFDEFYYPHDMEGGLFSILSHVYPNAEKICIGDGLGNVYDRAFHLSFNRRRKEFENSALMKIKQAAGNCKNQLRRGFRRLLSGRSRSRKADWDQAAPKPDRAALVLPIDQAGNYFDKVPLTVCPRSSFLQVVEECRRSCIELESYLSGLRLKHKGNRKYLLLSENLAEGKFLSFEQDIAMYTHVLCTHCEPGSVVYVKPHPLETLDRIGAMQKNLNGRLEVVAIDSAYARFPVELWKGLLDEAKVICMSYPVLSLKFIYNIDVIQYMDDEFIEHWFAPWLWQSYKDSLSRYMQPLKKLASWDGNSVLYSGNIQTR